MLHTTIKKGPKHFITLDNVKCFKDIEIERGQHTFYKGLVYTTTNAHYLSNGDLWFELWDDEGYIGWYVIFKEQLHLIEEISEEAMVEQN